MPKASVHECNEKRDGAALEDPAWRKGFVDFALGLEIVRKDEPYQDCDGQPDKVWGEKDVLQRENADRPFRPGGGHLLSQRLVLQTAC